jgi:hypothetical protein
MLGWEYWTFPDKNRDLYSENINLGISIYYLQNVPIKK